MPVLREKYGKPSGLAVEHPLCEPCLGRVARHEVMVSQALDHEAPRARRSESLGDEAQSGRLAGGLIIKGLRPRESLPQHRSRDVVLAERESPSRDAFQSGELQTRGRGLCIFGSLRSNDD